jgi:short-subunit dehydrogenase
MGEDRTRIAPASFWLSAEQVVDESLAALRKGTLFVIPGWRYKWLAAALRSLPPWLKLKLETRGR